MMNDITDERIEQLRTEAGAAGDHYQVAICDRALNRDFGHGVTVSISVDAAREECARVITDAQEAARS
jgi:hypothetical protein